MAASNLHYFHPDWIELTDERLQADVCVYGGTASGVIAAIKATQLGKSAIILQPGKHLGGMSSGGLGWTDFGRKYAIGGMSRAFYREVGKHYGKDEEWLFEPHVAEEIFGRMVKEAGVTVRFCQYLDAVEMDRQVIKSITLLGGLNVEARMFLDATYEGDLLAKAGVSFHVGREANSVYGETLNGIQVDTKHQFSHFVDPYVVEGDPSSGLLPFIEDVDQSEHNGEGDRRVQAYNFRMCMTDDPALKIDWEKPEGFDPRQYVLASRWFAGEKDGYNDLLRGGATAHVDLAKFDVLPNKTPGGFHKTDTNNHGPVSSDFIGANWDWPEADYATREKIFQAHVTYQKGLYWFMANDESIPARYRDAVGRWGLPKDEFKDTEHWPHQLYVREGRRMVSDAVVTETDCRAERRAEDSVGLGSYNMDSHNCTRFVKIEDGKARVLNEGDVQVPPTDPYPISYKAIVPGAGSCENLLVPVCMSSSHIAFGSARMEPVFMVLGESAATAASLAIDGGSSVQDVPYDKLGPLLQDAKQVLG